MYSSGFGQLMEFLPDYLKQHGIQPENMFHCPHPQHDDKSPSAHVYKGKFVKCFGCGKVMTIFDIAHFKEGLPAKGTPEFFKGNIAVLAKRFGVALPTWSESTTLDIYSSVIRYIGNEYMPRVAKEKGMTATEYFHSLAPDNKLVDIQKNIPVTIEMPPIDEIVSHLSEEGFTALQIKLAGFMERIETPTKRIGIFPNEPCLAYPLWLSHSVCVGFSIKNPSGEPKYINTPNNDCFTKGKYLYGLFMGAEVTKPLYVVEGQKDCLALWARDYQAVAPLGSHLADDHIDMIVKRGFREVILCPDADNGGYQGSIASIEKFLKLGVMCRVVQLPQGKDPFDYLMEDDNEELPETISGIKLYIDYLRGLGDVHTVTAKIIDLISEVPNRVQRELMSKEIAEHLEISSDALADDAEALLQKKKDAKNNSVIAVLEKGLLQARNDPDQAIKLIQNAYEYAQEISQSKKHYNNDFTAGLVDQIISGQASSEHLDIHFRKGGLKVLSDMLHVNGIGWTKGTMMAVGGDPHTGKSALLLQVLVESLIYHSNVMCIHFSTDDASQILLPRIVSSLIFNPDFYISHATRTDLQGARAVARRAGLKKVREWAINERLIMKDQNFSNKFGKISDLVKYYRDKYPDRRIILFNDNFHRNGDYSDKDKLTKQELLANDAKALAVREDLSLWCTVEYRKNKETGFNRRKHGPVSADIKGDGALSYHANLIVNLYNDFIEQNADIDSSAYVHEHNGELFPRVDVNVSKNKISGNTGPLPMNLFPKCSFFTPVDKDIATQEAQVRLQQLGGN
jgi:hypothetical protein